jgi:hypothetical protein
VRVLEEMSSEVFASALLVALSLSCLAAGTVVAAGSCEVAAPPDLANTGKLTFGTGTPSPLPGAEAGQHNGL